MVLMTAGLILASIGTMCAQTIRYGFQQDADNPLKISAVAIPDFSSDNVTISTAVFSFSLPEDVVVSPAIEAVPASGSFIGHNGSWTAQKITPQVYRSVGFDESELLGSDIYQVVLQNAPELTGVEAGQPITLFSFELIDDCTEGVLKVLTNDGMLSNAIYGRLQANFNNQMSVSIDDTPAVDIYDESDPFSAEIECPLMLVSSNDFAAVEPSLMVQPNPAVDGTLVTVESPVSGNGHLIIYDIQHREVFRQVVRFNAGKNTFNLDITGLASSTYLLEAQHEDFKLQTKLLKVDN